MTIQSQDTILDELGKVKSNDELVSLFDKNGLGKVDSREWKSEWNCRWVVYADLIAFANRAKRSSDVVLNNIIRFDRASNVAKKLFSDVAVYRFSDATFGVSDSFSTALGFAIAMHHCCHAMNVEYLHNGKSLFIHTIVPRITMAKGNVLQLPENYPHESRFNELTPRSVLAGEGVVLAHLLEKDSAAGLLTFGEDGISELRKIKIRGDPDSIKSGFEKWHKSLVSLDSQLFVRGKYLDFPWLLVRPFQKLSGEIWCATRSAVANLVTGFLDTWELSAREFYSQQCADMKLDPMKHYCAAIRHASQCAQLRSGQPSRKYYTATEIKKLLATK